MPTKRLQRMPGPSSVGWSTFPPKGLKEGLLEEKLQPKRIVFAVEDWQPNPLPEQRHRRSLHALKLRGLRDPLMEVFNEPSPEISCEARESSTVAPQVFSLFNSEITLDRAVALAVRLKEECVESDREDIVERAFKIVDGRSPVKEEVSACREHWKRMTERHQSIEVPKPDPPLEVVRKAFEENTGEKLEFVEQLEFYEDFVPDRKRADVDPDTRGLAELCLVLFNSNEFAYVY